MEKEFHEVLKRLIDAMEGTIHTHYLNRNEFRATQSRLKKNIDLHQLLGLEILESTPNSMVLSVKNKCFMVVKVASIKAYEKHYFTQEKYFKHDRNSISQPSCNH